MQLRKSRLEERVQIGNTFLIVEKSAFRVPDPLDNRRAILVIAQLDGDPDVAIERVDDQLVQTNHLKHC